MDYFTFPMETLNVTQNYLGTTSHYLHTTGTPKDYPIDIAGMDSAQSAVFARVPLKVVAKRGIGNSKVTNTVWLETIDPVITPTFTDYAWMTLTHWNDNDSAMKKWQVGAIIPIGSIICYEGTDGATANHIHLVCGKGKSNNWTESSNGKWVMVGESIPPEKVLFIEPTFTTTIKNSGDLLWKNVPRYIGIPVKRDVTKNQIEILVDKLNVRESSSVESVSFGYLNLGVYDYIDSVQDENYSWYLTEYGWVANNGTWMAVYQKKTSCQEQLTDVKRQIEEKTFTIQQLGVKLKGQEAIISQLEKQLQVQNNKYLNFVVTKTGYYYIQLNKGEKLIYYIDKPDD